MAQYRTDGKGGMMEWRLDAELERELEYPPSWWYLMTDDEYCDCGNELTLAELERGEEVCEDCR